MDSQRRVLECDGWHAAPDRFNPDELRIAGENKVIIKTNYSNTVQEAYLSNTCPWCHTFIGNHYLPEHYFEAIYGSIPFERVSVGFFCKKCD